MGKMKQMWRIGDVRSKINNTLDASYEKVEKELYDICLDAAQRARNEHDYNNYKGQLESSIGFVILKNRQEVKHWGIAAKSGSDPGLGLQDIRNLIYDKIIGKHSLPDGTEIPSKSIVGIVFAAAPYAGTVESYGRKVLIDFAPNDSSIFRILKTVIR